MNKKQPVAIVLGGTYPHKRLIKNLKKRGYYTILIDYLEYSPAIIDADEHIRESTLDQGRVLAIAKEKNAELVISTCIDQANVTACFVGEKLGLPVPYSYEQALMVSNKVLMKNRMLECFIPTANYREFSDVNHIDVSELKYPLIVKPSDSNSSKGVRKVTEKTELIEAVKNALSISRDKKIIIEEYLNGKEIGIDCVIKGDNIDIIMTRERRKMEKRKGAVEQIIGSFWPASLTDSQLLNIKVVATNIAKSFGLNNTLLMIQAILVEDEVFVLEFAPRIGGGENYKIIELLTGCDVIDLSIDSFLQNPIKALYQKALNVCADIYLYANPGTFDRIEGLNELKKTGKILYWHQFKKKGYPISDDLSSNNRVGSFVVIGKNRKKLIGLINEVTSELKILNSNSVNLFNKELYKN